MKLGKKGIKDYFTQGSKIYRYKSYLYYKIFDYTSSSDIDLSQLKLFFIVSTGRTGTRTLANFLNHFAINMALHEPSPDMLEEGNDYARNILDDVGIKRKFIAARKYYFNLALKKMK